MNSETFEYDLQDLTPSQGSVDSMQLMYDAGFEQGKLSVVAAGDLKASRLEKNNEGFNVANAGSRRLRSAPLLVAGLTLSVLLLCGGAYWIFQLQNLNDRYAREISNLDRTNRSLSSKLANVSTLQQKRIAKESSASPIADSKSPISDSIVKVDAPLIASESEAFGRSSSADLVYRDSRSFLMRGVSLHPSDSYRVPIEERMGGGNPQPVTTQLTRQFLAENPAAEDGFIPGL